MLRPPPHHEGLALPSSPLHSSWDDISLCDCLLFACFCSFHVCLSCLFGHVLCCLIWTLLCSSQNASTAWSNILSGTHLKEWSKSANAGFNRGLGINLTPIENEFTVAIWKGKPKKAFPSLISAASFKFSTTTTKKLKRGDVKIASEVIWFDKCAHSSKITNYI